MLMPHGEGRRLRAAAITITPGLYEEFQGAMSRSEQPMDLLAHLPEYPSSSQLARLLRADSPQVLFVEFHNAEDVRQVLSRLDREAVQMPVVGLGGENGQLDMGLLKDGVRLGLRDFLIRPFDLAELDTCVRSVKRQLAEAPTTLQATDQIYSFLPARPGVGTSTLTVNTAAALQRARTSVLLVDLDLACGMTRFLLQLGRRHSVADAVLYASELEPELWPQLVDQSRSIDVLHSGRLNPQAQIHAGQLEALIDYARHQYGALCFDLSGNFEAYSIQVLQDSKYIFLVTTPEPGALQLAREKLAYLESMELLSRTKVVVNRAGQCLGLQLRHIPEVLKKPLCHCFRNDYAAVAGAVRRGEFVPEDSRLGMDCDQFVTKLIKAPTAGGLAARPLQPARQPSREEQDTSVSA